MHWKRLSTIVTDDTAEPLSDLLSEHGAVSVSVEPAASTNTRPLYEPGPGETPMWKFARVTGLFNEGADIAATQHAITTALGLDHDAWYCDQLQDQVWERVWMDDFKPRQVGPKLWICPSWQPPPDPDAINILMDPGLAFGSGTHATTELCLEWLEQHPPQGAEVIDFGCGSGILAIAALRLGAVHALGIDYDPQAIVASNENAQRNAVAEQAEFVLPGERQPADCDLLLANVLATPLISLAPQLTGWVKPGGHIVLSGILASQADQVAACYAGQFTLDPIVQRDDWVRLSGTRRD